MLATVEQIREVVDLERRAAEASLAEFVFQAWDSLEPGTHLRWSWHLDALCEHLEAVSRGQIQNLLINIPPGCMKSYMVSVLWPAWEWAKWPELRYLCASYDQALSTRDNRRVRDLVLSDWYQARWPHVQLRVDQNQKTRFDTTRGGWRIGTSVGGRATGEHPNRKIVDDPHTPSQSLSAAERAEVQHWFDHTLSTRGAALGAATVVIMQRLHEQDLSGHILERGGFEHICLPMRWEPNRMSVTSIGWQDPRNVPGALLWPEHFPPHVVDDLRARLGEAGDAGQEQQRPAPEGGGLFKRAWFPLGALPQGVPLRRCRFWDCAGTEKKPGKDPDWTVGTLVAIAPTGLVYIEDVIRERVTSAAVDALMLGAARSDPRGTLIREEQEPGSSGKAVVASHVLMLQGYDYSGAPATGEKTTRWRPFAVQAEAGNVRLVPGAAGQPRPWVQAWLDEMALVPFASHDDQADSASGGFLALALGPQPGRQVKVLWG